MGAKKGGKPKLLMPHWENVLRNQENGCEWRWAAKKWQQPGVRIFQKL